jgi:membrane protein
MNKTLRTLKLLVLKIDADDCLGLAAEMSYNLVLSLVPAMLVFVSFFSLVQSPKTIILLSDLIGQVLPEEVYSSIDKAIEKLVAEKRGGIFTVSLIFAIYSSASVFTTIMKAMERIYKAEVGYHFLRRQLIAVELVLIVSISLGIVFSLLIFGYELEQILESKFRWHWLGSVVSFTRFPIAFIVMVMSMLLVYKFSLRIGQKLQHILPGAVFMSVCWMLLCAWFGEYVKYQSYGQTYTVLAKVIAILVWMYFNSLIFLLGAEINSLFHNGFLSLEQWSRKTLSRAKSETEKLEAEKLKTASKSPASKSQSGSAA